MIPADPDLPALLDLLDEKAFRELLDAAVAERTTAVNIAHVSYRPGRRAIVRYNVTIEADDGSTSANTFTAWTGRPIPAGGLRLSSGSGEVAVWRFPDDPWLPGLATAATPARTAALLGDIGLSDPAPIVAVRAYWPGRRAVFEVLSGDHRVFIKAVRPERVEALQRTHRALAEVVPVPRSLGWSPQRGLVVLEALPGRSLAELLRRGDASLAPDASDLTALLDRIAQCDIPGEARPAALARFDERADTLAVVLPDLAPALDDLRAALSDTAAQSNITAHRDFHASQLMIHEDVVRLVDIDTVGRGARADDAAMFIAQVICLGRPGRHAAAIGEYVRLLGEGFSAAIDEPALRHRTAASLIGFALGPFRVQEPDWPRETRRRVSAAAEQVLGVRS